ncbi:short coiled-coil protein B-like [Watersipora subatra]|uniref:short coiled-coil protein B-like n=1 Tax=Watersipora subatra TaxID=2589382 RepID=UPI00355C3323
MSSEGVLHIDEAGPATASDEDVLEEKQRLITQILGLQNTLDALSSKVDTVKEKNIKLKSENQVLGTYIEKLMSTCSVFQKTDPPTQFH